jgi:hypothetical protein
MRGKKTGKNFHHGGHGEHGEREDHKEVKKEVFVRYLFVRLMLGFQTTIPSSPLCVFVFFVFFV